MNIIEGNKLIAEFMGGKTSDKSRIAIGHQNIWLPFHGICRWDTIEIGKGKILEYHSSWDWLMPVVEKIENLEEVDLGDLGLIHTGFKINDLAVSVNIQANMCDIILHSATKHKTLLVRKIEDNKIQSVWSACVEFIKYYNENTSSLQS